jgi:NADH-quinone oxidoreductase subunit G
VTLDTRTDVVVRIRPRTNTDVNGHFMCDEGRTLYRGMNRGDRIEAPLVNENGTLAAVDWDHALNRAAQVLKGAKGKAVLLASAQASNEALFLARKLLDGFDVTAAVKAAHATGGDVPLDGVPNLALRTERAPNVAGAKALGFTDDFDKAAKAVNGAAVVLLLDTDPDGLPAGSLAGAANVIYLGTVLRDSARGAHVVLPVANVAEEDGTFVNRDRRVQRFFQAKSAPGMARPTWWVAGELLAEMGKGESLADAGEAFAKVAAAATDFSGMSYATLGANGTVLGAGKAMAGASR